MKKKEKFKLKYGSYKLQRDGQIVAHFSVKNRQKESW